MLDISAQKTGVESESTMSVQLNTMQETLRLLTEELLESKRVMEAQQNVIQAMLKVSQVDISMLGMFTPQISSYSNWTHPIIVSKEDLGTFRAKLSIEEHLESSPNHSLNNAASHSASPHSMSPVSLEQCADYNLANFPLEFEQLDIHSTLDLQKLIDASSLQVTMPSTYQANNSTQMSSQYLFSELLPALPVHSLKQSLLTTSDFSEPNVFVSQQPNASHSLFII
jgi:hypothetical protein